MQSTLAKMTEEECWQKHKELCQQLNMDEGSMERSWQSYKSINNVYTLDGNLTHWLCCSIFVACRSQVTRTVGDQASVLEGNCVSLTRLLRICGISIYEFFKIIKTWMEMASTPKILRTKVEKLERSFAVSVLLFRKFGPIFEDLFKCPKLEMTEKTKSNKKTRPVPCSPKKLLEFCWGLFVCAKGEFPDSSVDLVTSFHMLLCCCDLIYANAINDKRKDLVSSSFSGIPPNWMSDTFDPASVRPHCILQNLCNLYEGTAVDAIQTKTFTWKKVIDVFFSKGILKGDATNFMDILQPGNFEHNQKSINNAYETYLLSCGEVDERIFLSSKNFSATPAEDETIQSLVHQTPLTGRAYLNPIPSRNNSAPLAIAQDNVSKLRHVFANFDGEIPAGLLELVRRCDSEATISTIKERLDEMKQVFDDIFPATTDRWHYVIALYYHLLQKVVEGELKIRPNLDISMILRENTVQKTLIIVCVEIVVYCYNYNRRFPAVLKRYGMHPFNFYRIIEMVVLYQECLTRDIIKHLNMIEEQTLESFAWESNSPIWERIRQYGQKLPMCQTVDRPKMIGDEDLEGITPHNPNFRRSDVSSKQLDLNFLRSPSKTVKKQLFQDDSASPRSNTPAESNVVPIAMQLSDEASNSQDDGVQSSQSNLLASVKKTNKAGSLGLFFRKFYKLASVRMLALCNGLEINNPELLKKIWTIFEHSIVEQTDLMKDRHLDQMIMCAIYVMFRVAKYKTSFTDIMRCYRLQPQSASHVYRSVLIEIINNEQPEDAVQQVIPCRAEPGDLAAVAQNYGNEKRGDIILFYNKVYVQKMQTFALKFAETTNENNLLLSPLPHNPNQIMSPKKVSEHHKIYIQPLGKNVLKSPGSTHCITYQFPRSPIKDSPAKGLMEINRLTSQMRTTKRSLNHDETTNGNNKGGLFGNVPKLAKIRKFENLISDRQEQNKD